MTVIIGVMLHAVGASFASLCYTPEKKVVGWSWQTYWLAQAFVCWLILPLLVAWFTIPQLMTVLQVAPSEAMWKSFLLGMAYGVGGTAFGLAIRYMGFSLTYAISIGISCIIGTLLPPFVKGELYEVFARPGAEWIALGMFLGVIGIALCGKAGREKEMNMEVQGLKTGSTFSIKKGLPLCLLAGVLSALYGFSIDQGQPIADVALEYGAGNYQSNVIYIFSNTGAFVTTFFYCFYLHFKEKTFSEFKISSPGFLKRNYALAALTGVLWYAQFFFYGLGHVRMGDYKFTSWAVHMIMLVMFSTLAGVMMGEWSMAKRKTINYLVFAMFTLLLAVLLLTFGNYLAE
ncbi:L-rhamnose/proton symporter RhaT [Belliella marina]|uniref:L-rhamnose/proton symporter RhaT n=1 Tax=Belliella marina TaxID=1644146 RepID=A0ABW4VPC3_9BACT